MKEKTCCFIGHRKIRETETLRTRLFQILENLIRQNGTDTFLFGSKSEFNTLCWDTVTTLKEKYPHIRRIYVRAEFPVISEDYRAFLLERYEDTYYPEHMAKAGKAAYVERNYAMIDRSQVCILYLDPDYAPPKYRQSRHSIGLYQPPSGTKIAWEYACKKAIRIIDILTNSTDFPA